MRLSMTLGWLEYPTITSSTKLPGSCAGIISGSFCTSFCPRSSDLSLQMRCSKKGRIIFVQVVTHLSRSNLPMRLTDMATLKFVTTTN